MFKLFTGSYRELEKALLQDVTALRKTDPLGSLLVLSPSTRLLDHLQRQFTKQMHPSPPPLPQGARDSLNKSLSSTGERVQGEGLSACLNIHFLTFYALAERLLQDSGLSEPVMRDEALFKEIIRDLLEGRSEVEFLNRSFFHNPDDGPLPLGLCAALAGTLRDLRDSGARVVDCLKVALEGHLGEGASAAAPTLELYARMYAVLQKNGLRTAADMLRRAGESAPGHPWLDRQKAVFIYGFYDLTGVQLDLVLSLADHPDARVYFPYLENIPAYAFAEKLLKDPAFTSKVSSSIPLPDVGEGGGEGGRPLGINSSRTLTRSPYSRRSTSPQPGEAQTHAWSCSGVRDEVWFTANEILRLNDEGAPFDQIAVIARNITPYLTAFREILDAHCIPYWCSRNEPAGSHPLIKTLRTLLMLGDPILGARPPLKDLEKSPYIKRLPDPISDGETPGSWSFHVSWAGARIEQCAQLPADAGEEESALWQDLLGALHALKNLDVLDRPVSRHHFLEVWDEKLQCLERPVSSRPHAGVQVLDAQQARGLSFRAVFLIGMNEKVFPRLIREDPFLPDKTRSSLAQTTGCRLGRKLDGYEEERLLFELMRGMASDALYILSQRSDEEGKVLTPSIYLKDMQRAVTGLEAKWLPRGLAPKADIPLPTSWTPKELSILMNRVNLDSESLYAALGWDLREFHRLLAVQHAMEGVKPGIGPYDGSVKDQRLVKDVLERGFSPSGLEDLAECPFQYYAGHVLGIVPEEIMVHGGEISPETLGKLYHRTLELFYQGCKEKGLSPYSVVPASSKPGPMLNRDGPRPTTCRGDDEGIGFHENDLENRLRGALDACFNEFSESLAGVYHLIASTSKEFIYKSLTEFLKNDIDECKSSGFQPMWFEQPLEGSIPELETSPPRVFRGKPDRIDLRENSGMAEIRVVDYKSGKPKSWSGKIETQLIKGKFLQLPIYLGLASSFAEKVLGRKVQASHAILRSVRDADEASEEKILTSDFWTQPASKIFAENIRVMLGLVEKARFYIEPSAGEWGYCARCDYARICRKEHMPTRLRAERDAARLRARDKLGRSSQGE